MAKLTAPFGLLLGAAVWLLLFVILRTGLGTAFIAGGVVAGAGLLARRCSPPARFSMLPR
jgi:hypothetical protein